jgi:hypothetical protein
MQFSVIKVDVLTDGSGNFSYTTMPVTGVIEHVRYTPDASAPLDTGADLDIVGGRSGIVVANHDDIGTSAFTRAYRQATHGVTGAAALYAAGGTAVNDKIAIAGEVLTLTIAQGGAAKAGVFEIVLSH